MARLALSDYLQNFSFWLMDVGPINARSAPVLSPVYGFSSISAPKIDAKTQKIEQANHYHAVPVITGGDVGEITMRRGAAFGDAEFYRWILAGITGNPAARPATALAGVGGTIVFIRRTLLLVQFFARLPFVTGGGTNLSSGAGRIGSQGGLVGAFLESVLPAPFTGGIRLPARAWLLKGCVPSKYTAASDFDATDSNISLMELTVLPEKIEEINLGV